MFARTALLGGLALLAVPALAQTLPASDPALDAARDARLSRRFTLRSEGMPVSHVIRRLSAKTGVPLTVTGRAGDERLIAFVPDSTLAEILASIADLYNLKWGRASKDGKVSYQLFKPPARVREETQLKEKALREGLADLDRQARELPKIPTLRQPHRLALRRAAIALARENWQRLTEDGQLVFLLKDLPAERRENMLTHAHTKLLENQQIALEHDRDDRQRLLDNGQDLPDHLKEEPQPRPLGDPDTWRLIIDLKLNEGVELKAMLDCGNFGSGFFNSSAHQGEALGLSLYKDRDPRPSVPPGQVPPLSRDDPFSKPLYAPKAPPIKPSDPPNLWLNALENLSVMGGLAVYSDDYSNPDGGGDRQAAQPPFNGQSAQAYLDQLCFLTVAKPANFWWRRDSTAFVRSRRYLYEADSLLPAAFTDRLLSRQGTALLNLLLPEDLAALSRLTLPQLNGILPFSGAHEGWKRSVQIPARLSPPFRALALTGGLRWEVLPPTDQLLAQQLSQGNHAVGHGYFARVSASVSPPSDRSRSAIRIRLETDLTPASAYEAALPAPQANPQGLIVMEPETVKTPQAAVERLVIAKYYPWFGLESVSGQRRNVRLGLDKVANFTHNPASGPYDSSDEATIRRHAAQLKSAGVDVLACQWPGPGTFEEKVLRKLAPIASTHGLRVCLMLEQFKRQSPAMLAASLNRASKELGESCLKLEGKPVVLIGEPARDLYTHQEWADLLQSLAKSASPGFVFVASAHDPAESLVFSGAVINSGASWGPDDTPLSVARTQRLHTLEAASLVLRRKRICAVQVTPGLDFTHISVQAGRLDGAYYKAFWSAALDCGADWVLINSFNQWEIGTEIEPSREFGDLYLKLTAEHAALFKGKN